MSASLSAFTDFYYKSTGPAFLTDPNQFVNDAQLRNYEAFDLFSRSRKAVSGGNQIKEKIIFDSAGVAATYLPSEAVNLTNVQGIEHITVNWRRWRTYVTWNESEVMLNEGGGDMFHQWANIRDAKWVMAWTDIANLMEKMLLADAANQSSSMESVGGKEPYSVFATVTSDGLAPTGWTTVQGQNPTTQTKWRNQTANYTAASFLDTDSGLIAGFDEIYTLVNFKAPNALDAKFFTGSSFENCVILTNREGTRDYMKALRANNDYTRAGANDPSHTKPVYDGVPVKPAEGMDEESSFSSGSPGFLFLNGNFIKFVFHPKKWFEKSEQVKFPDKPDTQGIYLDCWGNVVNQSRQRHGYLSAA